LGLTPSITTDFVLAAAHRSVLLARAALGVVCRDTTVLFTTTFLGGGAGHSSTAAGGVLGMAMGRVDIATYDGINGTAEVVRLADGKIVWAATSVALCRKRSEISRCSS
jgi:hypothetical protein